MSRNLKRVGGPGSSAVERRAPLLVDAGGPQSASGESSPSSALPWGEICIVHGGRHLRDVPEMPQTLENTRRAVLLGCVDLGSLRGSCLEPTVGICHDDATAARPKQVCKEPMNVTTQEIDSVTVVRIEGSLDTNTSPGVQEHFDGLLEQGASKILVDFEKVDYVSSAGLRVLLGTVKRLTAAGGSLRISGLSETVNEVFEISGFSTILAVYATEAEALQGF